MTTPEDPTERFGGPPPNLDKPQQYRPTEQYPVNEQYGQPQPYPEQYPGQYQGGGYHTSDPYAAYGHDTRSFPTAYGDPATQWGPGGEALPLEQQRPPGPSKAPMWIALAAVVALVAVIGIGAVLLLGNSGDNNTNAASGTTTTAVPSTSARPSIEATLTPPFTIPDIPLPTDILNDFGLVSGTITAIDGSTLTIDPSLGDITRVTTSNSTLVLTTSGTSVADLAVGQQITAQGDVTGDTLAARFITDISIGIPN